MLETVRLAGVRKILGDVAGAIVGYNPCDRDAEAFRITHGSLQEREGTLGLLVGEDVGESDARCIVDADMHVFPANAALVVLAGPVAGDAMSDPIKAAEALDVEVDQAAWLGILVAHYGFGGNNVIRPR